MRIQKLFSTATLVALIILCSTSTPILAQVVPVGSGSYTTVYPPGAVGPRQFNGVNATPKISATLNKPVQTNDYWSSLIFPFFGDPHSNVMHAHPAYFRARANGLEIGHTPKHVFVANDYLYPYNRQLTVGIAGLNATRTVTDDYGDWTVVPLWEDGLRTLRATLGHGLPFAFFTLTGGNARITTASNPTIWYNQNGVIGLTIAGIHYGIFAPHGSVWTGTSTLESTLNGKDYLAVALLPDNTTATLEFFRLRAYAHVTDSQVSWQYNESTAKVTSAFTYTVDLKEDLNGNLPQTLTALYRHQWTHTGDPLTAYSYPSKAGTMKLFDGNTFTTEVTFDGVLPSLPDLGIYNRADLLTMVQTVAQETLPLGPTYENGKLIGRFARLVHIADQLGATTERDHFLAQIKMRLESWLTATGPQQYVYNATWNVLTGYPSGYGADDQINDHSFHSGYAIMGAATVAQYDPDWARQERWGAMINLLIKDSNNWERTDTRFPFLRGHDPYAGHSWAAGHGDFGDGNNQESSSESMHFAAAVVLWGTMTDQPEIRDLGIFLHATERTAVEEYWFDVNKEVFPDGYGHIALGMVWGGKGVHSTWFGADPEFIHGINLLPITGGSLYLGRHPDYVLENVAEIVRENSGPPTIWQDVIWQFLATADADRALAEFLSDPDYPIFDGESMAHTYHWLGNYKRLGHLDTTVTASLPTAAAFRRSGTGVMSYAAFNALPDSADIQFSDGFTLRVGPRRMGWDTTDDTDPAAPVVLLSSDGNRGKSPLRVQFNGSRSYDPNGEELTFAWTLDDETTSTEADPFHIYTQPGTYVVTLTVTNSVDKAATESTEITVLGSGTPYLGSPVVVPGRILAENYDLGGQHIAYFDVDENNIGLAYRPNEGVDILPSANGSFSVYWMVAREWLEYTITVPEAGRYDIVPYLTTVPGFGNFRILVNNVDVSGKRAVPGTGGWENWTAFPVANVPLEAGTQILRFEVDSDSDKLGWLYSLNYIDVRVNTSTSLADADDDMVTVFALEANYPNPFNPETQIQFALPQAMPVRLDVYAMSGEKVATLVNQAMPSGRHTVVFNAAHLASGVYLIQIQTPLGRINRKMTLLK